MAHNALLRSTALLCPSGNGSGEVRDDLAELQQQISQHLRPATEQCGKQLAEWLRKLSQSSLSRDRAQPGSNTTADGAAPKEAGRSSSVADSSESQSTSGASTPLRQAHGGGAAAAAMPVTLLTADALAAAKARLAAEAPELAAQASAYDKDTAAGGNAAPKSVSSSGPVSPQQGGDGWVKLSHEGSSDDEADLDKWFRGRQHPAAAAAGAATDCQRRSSSGGSSSSSSSGASSWAEDDEDSGVQRRVNLEDLEAMSDDSDYAASDGQPQAPGQGQPPAGSVGAVPPGGSDSSEDGHDSDSGSDSVSRINSNGATAVIVGEDSSSDDYELPTPPERDPEAAAGPLPPDPAPAADTAAEPETAPAAAGPVSDTDAPEDQPSAVQILAKQLAQLDGGALFCHKGRRSPRAAAEPFNVPNELQRAVGAVLVLLQRVADALQQPDAELLGMLRRLEAAWEMVQGAIAAANAAVAAARLAGGRGGGGGNMAATVLARPIFLFKDGSVTKGVQLGRPLLLEDYDAPSPAVTERINPLLETEPTLTVSEDVTADAGGRPVAVTASTQVFATMHTSSGGGSRGGKISPATRSRFTEVVVSPYEDAELRMLVERRFHATGSSRGVDAALAVPVAEMMFEVRQVMKGSRWARRGSDLRALLSWAELAAQLVGTPRAAMAAASASGSGRARAASRQPQPGGTSYELAVLWAARFSYLEHLTDLADVAEVLKAWWARKQQAHAIPAVYMAVAEPPPHLSDLAAAEYESPILLTRDPLQPAAKRLQLAYTGLSVPLPSASEEPASNGAVAPPQSQEEVAARLRLTTTPSLLLNLASVFAALMSGAPLLMEGPPGIGKTAIIEQVRSFRNPHCLLRD